MAKLIRKAPVLEVALFVGFILGTSAAFQSRHCPQRRQIAPQDSTNKFSHFRVLSAITTALLEKETTASDSPQLRNGGDYTGKSQERIVRDEALEINLKLDQLASHCVRRGRTNTTAAVGAYELFRTMRHPDTVSYNSVLKAFAKCSPLQLDLHNDMMKMMMMASQANTTTFVFENDDDDLPNIHITTTSAPLGAPMPIPTTPKTTAAECARQLLDEMIQVNQQQRTANQAWHERSSQGTLTEEELSRGPPVVRVRPNVRSFSTVMDAWSRQGNVDAAMHTLHELEARYEASGQHAALRPNIVSYNTVLSAFSRGKANRDPDASSPSTTGTQLAEQCEALLERMPVDPDAISYNSVMQAWARSEHPNAGERAETLLRQMPMAPNARSYTTVMDAWSRSSNEELADGSTAAERAHALLEEMKELYQRTQKEQLRPNCVSYSVVIHAYALSKLPFKAKQAFELLQEMRNEYERTSDPKVKPNRVTYNSVLNACATSSPIHYMDEDHSVDKQANRSDGTEHHYNKSMNRLQEIVLTLYHQLLQEDRPDHYTFGTVLKACANLFWDDPNFCVQVFREACARGEVSFGVLHQLRQAAPASVFRKLLPEEAYDTSNGHFSMAHIPVEWKRNVREQQWKRGNRRNG